MFNLSNVEVNEGSKYLGAGVHKCKVASWEDKGDYIEYVIKSKTGEKGVRFYKVKETDKDIVKEIKSRQLKEFLINSGVTNFTKDQAAIASATGATLNVILRDREYWVNDRDTGEPVIKTITEYLGSRKEGVEATFQSKWNKGLNADDRASYEAALAAHKTSNEPVSEETDSPF